MIFVADRPLKFHVRAADADLFDVHGTLQVKGRRGLGLEFRRGHAPDWVARQAAARFSYNDRPLREMGHDPVPVETWVAWYDSVADQTERVLSDEERAVIEDYLLSAPGVVRVDDEGGGT